MNDVPAWFYWAVGALVVFGVLFFIEWRVRVWFQHQPPIVPVNAGTLADMRDTIERLTRERDKLREDKHYAFYERNMVVSLMAAALSIHQVEAEANDHDLGWVIGESEDPQFGEWKRVLYFDPPSEWGLGQLNWHFHTDHGWMLDAIGAPKYKGEWDGRTRQAKYTALEKFLRRWTEPAGAY